MSTPLLNCFSMGDAMPESQILIGVEVKLPRGLDAEVGDAPVRDGVVIDLLAGHALLVDQDDPAVGEDEGVAHKRVTGDDLLVGCEQLSVLLDDSGRIQLPAFPISPFIKPIPGLHSSFDVVDG